MCFITRKSSSALARFVANPLVSLPRQRFLLAMMSKVHCWPLHCGLCFFWNPFIFQSRALVQLQRDRKRGLGAVKIVRWICAKLIIPILLVGLSVRRHEFVCHFGSPDRQQGLCSSTRSFGGQQQTLTRTEDGITRYELCPYYYARVASY